MNLNLACQFLAGFSPDKVGLGNNFQGPGRCLVLWSLYRLDSFNLVALSEASFAKEAAPGVGDQLPGQIVVLRIYWLHFLLDNLSPEKTEELGKNSTSDDMLTSGQ